MKEMSSKYQTLIEILDLRYKQEPQKIAYTFVKYEGAKKEEINLTYADLYENAKAVAVHLTKHGIKSGDRVIILSTQTYDNIYSIFGAIFAQAVFVMTPPPIDESKKLRFKSVLESSESKLILCSDIVADKLEQSLFPKYIPRKFMRFIVKKSKKIEILSVEKFKKYPEKWVWPNISANTLAYLQYSSGSTSEPKGVMVSHENIINNVEGAKLFFEDIIPNVFVSWAPLFHNMGILSLVFASMYVNARSVIMSPLSFVEKPADWFRAVTEYKGDLIIGPNSAFDFCSRIITNDELKSIDLSTIKYAISGSEVINYKTLQAFYDRFKICGFNYSAFCGGYGLAESTCYVSGARFSTKCINIDYEQYKKNIFVESNINDSSVKQVIGLGKPFEGVEAVIVKPDTDLPCGKNEIGELLLKSGSVVKGYWKMEDETSKVFKAPVQGKDGYFMRTGDLAAIYEGEIYIVGRLKEIIIINGHNIFPQDIEVCVWENVSELKGYPIVSFAINTDGKERFITCIEVSEKVNFNYNKVYGKINKAIHKLFDIVPFEILFVIDGSLPRTDNKKIQVIKTKEAYEENRLNILHSSKMVPDKFNEISSVIKPIDAIETNIILMMKSVIGSDDEIGTEDNFFSIGGDSLAIVQLSNLLEKEYGINMPIDNLMENPTVKDIANFLKASNTKNHIEHAKRDISILYNDCQLDASISPQSSNYCGANNCKHIFVTGATGFIGAHLIKELMETTDAELFCLVRESDIKKGFIRIKENMKYYKVWNDNFESRLKPVIGDLSKPLLGMEESLYEKLSWTIDSIYHSGAQLNFIYPYSYLRNINVGGTIECLRLACRGNAKYFHHISTYSVYDNPSHFNKIVSEDDELSSAEGYFLAYSESKWVSEQLVRKAQDRGLKVNIYRPGEVCGSKDTGIWKLGDMVSRFLVSAINLGELPDIPMNIHITPVDYISKSIVCLSMQENSIGKAFNLINKQTKKLNELSELITAYGYSIKLVPYEEWRVKLGNSDNTNLLSPLKPLFLGEDTADESFIRRYGDLEAKYDNKNVLIGLTNKNITCPPVSKEFIFKYLDHFVEMGYIKPIKEDSKPNYNSAVSTTYL